MAPFPTDAENSPSEEDSFHICYLSDPKTMRDSGSRTQYIELERYTHATKFHHDPEVPIIKDNWSGINFDSMVNQIDCSNPYVSETFFDLIQYRGDRKVITHYLIKIDALRRQTSHESTTEETTVRLMDRESLSALGSLRSAQNDILSPPPYVENSNERVEEDFTITCLYCLCSKTHPDDCDIPPANLKVTKTQKIYSFAVSRGQNSHRYRAIIQMTCPLACRLEVEAETASYDIIYPHIVFFCFNVNKFIGIEKWAAMMTMSLNTRKLDQAKITAGKFIHVGSFVDLGTLYPLSFANTAKQWPIFKI
ncbi:unnamed protein product [Kuraishia capsulata CBS 1993]|uniref:Uncharacterized protein n=1 Tax=Kuraishia capsulata CBS 1993 TaxID=1382522 RepID=W6MS04_9ASCO|nr:uncharacterized protein KUCA_T00000571001 [Kuraishia capsulata CBS 1993]CDK24605.1 unnamed protein product [Kuraishia capsulata CBS 1993]